MSIVDVRPTVEAPDDDPYLWLEERESSQALAWVEAQNSATMNRFFDSAAVIRSGGTALRLFNRDGAIEPVYLSDCSRTGLLSKSRRADDGEGRSASQHDLCDVHGSLPVVAISAISHSSRIRSLPLAHLLDAAPRH